MFININLKNFQLTEYHIVPISPQGLQQEKWENHLPNEESEAIFFKPDNMFYIINYCIFLVYKPLCLKFYLFS